MARPVDPSSAPQLPPIETDALVIGAGPVGLFQAFQLGLQGLCAHVVDSLPQPGGQCAELYGNKPIYDIPAIPVCTGHELIERLLLQLKPFGTPLHLAQEVTELRSDKQGFAICTSANTRFLAKTIVIVAGAGSFQARKLKVAGIEQHEGSQVFYESSSTVLHGAGKHALVIGGNASAVDAALALSSSDNPTSANSITLLHRRTELQADAAALELLKARIASGAIRFVAGQPSGFDEKNGRLASLQVTDHDGQALSINADVVLVFLGLSPRLGPIANWGLQLERKQLAVDTARFETSLRGIFAVGDINTYPGKKKLIVSGFHEATLAAFAAVALVRPDEPVHLQYTTTSPTLHQRLGVASLPHD